MGSIQYRLANDSDNDGIIALTERCPQEGMITFFINRTPKFNTIHRLLDPQSWHYVACDNEKIIGLVGIIHFEGKVLGECRRIGYMLDFRLDKEYRGSLVAFRLVKNAIDYLRKTGVNMVIANFLKDNNRSLVFAKGRAGIPPAYYLGQNNVFNLIAYRSYKPDNRFTIEKLTLADLSEATALYQRYASNFKIAPHITTELLEKYFYKVDGLSTDNFLVARENGQMKAIIGLWDEHIYKAYQVLKLNTWITVINSLVKILTPFMRVPQPIRLNQPLKQLSLVMYAHDNCPEALGSLFKYVNNNFRGPNYTLMVLYAQTNDPVFGLLKNYLNVTVNSEMYLFSDDETLFEKLEANKSPVMFDLTMTL